MTAPKSRIRRASALLGLSVALCVTLLWSQHLGASTLKSDANLVTWGNQVPQGSRETARHSQAQLPLGNRAVLAALNEIPDGGGYSTCPAASEFLRESVRLISMGYRPPESGESFCSSATYLVLLSALKKMEMGGHIGFSEEDWSRLVQVRLPDGHGAWGAWNSNGPGAARLINTSGLGYTFTDVAQARPGDFLKFFWTGKIGRAERGHLVVFLGLDKTSEGSTIKFWSSNKPDGMGVKEVSLSSVKNMIFSRLDPSTSLKIPSPSEVDELLPRMQREDFSWESVKSYCLSR